MKKKCTRCRTEKSLFDFSVSKRTKDNLRYWCKACESDYSRNAIRKSVEQDYEAVLRKRRIRNLKKMYGLTLEQYEEKLKAQDGGCKICGLPCCSGVRLAVDHDHATGKVRDLLCSNCNTGLGKFKDNPELLNKAADYLRKHSG